MCRITVSLVVLLIDWGYAIGMVYSEHLHLVGWVGNGVDLGAICGTIALTSPRLISRLQCRQLEDYIGGHIISPDRSGRAR
jgi:hypothetical protein